VLRTTLQPLLLDDSPPTGLRFVDPPPQARRQSQLTLTVSPGQAESGIDKVLLFKGRPTADGKPPPGAILYPAEPVNPEKTLWTGVVPLSELRPGPLPFSVQSISSAGLESFAETTIELTEGDPENLKPGQIVGTVTEGEFAQPNLEVLLIDGRGEILARVKTNTEGKFTFDNQPSGKFTITANKTATKRKGTATVYVEPGKTSTVALKLKLP
jgi:hypothetical protein